MKSIEKTKKSIFLLSFSCLFLTTPIFSGCCEDGEADICNIIALADLTIPIVADLFDQFGNPIIDQNTGQVIQGINELYFNTRTGELFNNQFPPTQGVLVGDVIQMATSIYNQFSETSCKVGSDATESVTAPILTVNGPFFNGQQPLLGMETPPISFNTKEFTATAFEVLTPGYYKVDFNANAIRNVEEHTFDNNFYFGNSGAYNRSNNVNSQISFIVEQNKSKHETINPLNYNNSLHAPKNLTEMKNLEIYKIINSERLGRWYQKKLESKI